MAKGRPDFSPTAVDVVLRPEWAAKEATDKSFHQNVDYCEPGESASVSYAVPAAKTFFVTQITGYGYAKLAADAELNQIMSGRASHAPTAGGDATILASLGGNGGVYSAPPVPGVVTGGRTVTAYLTNRSNHGMVVDIVIAGYEL